MELAHVQIGKYYQHKKYGKVLLVGSHPHDGAYLIVERDIDEFEETLIGCESCHLVREMREDEPWDAL